jgi:3-hydroxyisobutyrate dehydrogenase
MRVAFIGVGNMGSPMAANIVRGGHEVLLYDSNVGRAASVASQIGAQVLKDMADIDSVEIVVTMLPDGKIVRAVALGESGIASFARPGTIVIDMSSSEPLITRETGAALAGRQLILIDAPVSGGVERAKLGTLTIMIGGDDAAAVQRAKAILSCMGTTFFELGKLGAGHVAKALNNVVAASNYAVLAESLMVAQRYGINPQALVDVVCTSTGQSFISNVVMKQFVMPRTFNSGFKLGLLAKDTAIAAQLSTDLGCESPCILLAQQRWEQARDVLGADEDHSKAMLGWSKERSSP